MATIREIAEKLGVSISTVSKGLNGANDVSAELRQKILDTAVEMGYVNKRMKKETILSINSYDNTINLTKNQIIEYGNRLNKIILDKFVDNNTITLHKGDLFVDM